ncbi:aminodeoxychorismate synthase component I [Glaciihabitans sp. UYNi722]|uniref:aminodeoxychorismate synthase component I n=1 Tax=Glaciihabitans sp. UYNi722 TaxID=3156344 RepID=UPI0033928014
MRSRVLESPLAGWIDPARVFGGLYASHPHAVWLDSGMHAESGMSFLGRGSRLATSSVADRTVTVDGRTSDGEILQFLKEELEPASAEPGEGFRLGWVGWLGYELRAQTMDTSPRIGSRYPDAALLFVDRGIVFDHANRSMRLIALGDSWSEELSGWRDSTISALSSAADHDPVGETPTVIPNVSWAYGDDDYLAMIRECQEAIVDGDAYQICLTTEVRVDVRPDPFAAYLRLRAASPTHHGSLFVVDGLAMLSSSPELFLAVSPDRVVESRPIKGTRRRGSDPDEDAALARELESSDKERAENLMIVDLMRNDIGRVSEVGSVSVTRLLAVESYAQVHQLVSTVRGILAPGLTGIDAVAACFPAGSMTGAPKYGAVAILDRLEHRARGVYAGAFGYFGLDGRIDLAMVIRSIVLDGEGATIGTGGGITALSVPEEELDEVHLKVAALLAVLGAS